ncbi:MAG TPA: hypothetical protein VGH84_06410 [Steroidobacteraceae bacterium]|jgi:hypothetical protein
MTGGGGKSSSSSYSTGTTSTNIPDWLTSASQGAVQNAQAIAATPYSPYTGQIVADTPADTQAAYQAVRNMQGQYDPSYTAAQNAWGGVLGNLQSQTPDQQNAMTNALYGNYGQNVFNPAAGLLGQYMQQGPATAQQVGQNAMTLMSPYEAAVINPSLKLAQQSLAQNLGTIGSAANQAGAFGGARQGVMEGTAQSQAALGEGQMVGNLLNQGWQTAMTPATQVALQGGQQGYNAATGLAGMLGTGYQNAQQQAANMMNVNTGLGTTAAQQLPQIATAQQAADQKNASLLQSIGAAQQNQQQTELNAQIGQYWQQQEYPYQQESELLSALSSVPYSTSGTYTSYGTDTGSSSKNTAAGVMGGAATGASIGAAFGGVGAPIGAVAGGLLGALS